ncbi:hypothetical protein HYQ46_000742 [Verticillium longisporum]|nr:hypothetical protein HYQ46_000742 [Verticillium longisporum]
MTLKAWPTSGSPRLRFSPRRTLRRGKVTASGKFVACGRMGRGERSKKKKRFRSLSPLGRSGTPGGRGTPDTGAGYGGGGGGTLTDQERLAWKCYHCHMPGTSVWAVRDGPTAPRSLCHNCGLLGSPVLDRRCWV